MKFSRAEINETFFWDRVAKLDSCWAWTGFIDRKGYGRLNVKSLDTGARASIGAHRVSWVIRHGQIEGGLHVLHGCDNPRCVNPDHLRLGTHAENMADMKRRGRASKSAFSGQNSPCAKLTWEQVRHIRLLCAGTHPAHPRDVAERFGVTYQNVRQIIQGRTWREEQPRSAQNGVVIPEQAADIPKTEAA